MMSPAWLNNVGSPYVICLAVYAADLSFGACQDHGDMFWSEGYANHVCLLSIIPIMADKTVGRYKMRGNIELFAGLSAPVWLVVPYKLVLSL